jgi:putative FmdB family regulatory protein
MPLYEYECEACSHRFEVIQKFSDPPIEKCPKCGGAVRKLLSSPAIQFKGSGWYITDYAKKDQAAAPKPDDKAAPATKETPDKSAGTADKSTAASEAAASAASGSKAASGSRKE